jgi:hypothetical protein
MSKISIEGKLLNSAGLPLAGHLYLVYEDNSGTEWLLRGGPTGELDKMR